MGEPPGFLEFRQALSTYYGDLRDPLWWPQERPVPMRVILPKIMLAPLLPDTVFTKESACNAGDLVRSLGPEDPLEKGVAIHSSILA